MSSRQPVMRLQIVGVESDGLAVGRCRFFPRAGRAERVAEIGVGVGVVGAEGDGTLQRGAGLGCPSGLEEEDAETVVRLGVGRRRLGRLAQQHSRLVEATAPVAGDAGIMQDARISRPVPRQQPEEELVRPLRATLLHVARRAGQDVRVGRARIVRAGITGTCSRLPSSRSPAHPAPRRMRAIGRLSVRVAVRRLLPLLSRAALSGPSVRR